ncbi:relaxase/mobilization nuclease domain-containing protein [Adhaeribacter aquaticus]|uniref:relaxase/mobilization nuclease domain-containing protein n=1 Tax=Adhaeribacter aquaticus TaxID=299567 RepID=UPI0004056303|nr:relaxase/mobilization nuclease domain-containing protein [Adhaeribacter aquaticus]
MVARIIHGKDIIGLINYNEKAESTVLYAQQINDFKPMESLTLKDKIQAFQAYINLNPKISKPTFHVSLNPDPADKLTDEQLTEIGREYMERMNFGQQPFIIYKHEDIERVHIHIVSTSIQLNGKNISDSNERYRSEAIRKDIELKYNLVQASEKIAKRENIFEPINVEAIEYGKTDTKSAIANVVRSATRDYKFTSLAEFKTLLNQYNVTLDEVKDEKDPQKTLGLFYAVINPEGEKVSTRIKASKIDSKVGYTALLDKFSQDEKKILEGNLKTIISQKISKELAAYPFLNKADFKTNLKKQGIEVVYRHTKANRLFGITFIDTQSKTVINGRSLGKEFSAHTLNNRFTEVTLSRQDLQKSNNALIQIYNGFRKTDERFFYESNIIKALSELRNTLILLLQKQLPDFTPHQASLSVTNFINYRQAQLGNVQEKENGYFKANTAPLIDFIGQNKELTVKQKLTFLYANNITFSQKGEDLIIHAAKSQEVGYTLDKTSIFSLLQVPATKEKLNASVTEIPIFRKQDKALLKVLAQPEAERDYKSLPIEQINSLAKSPVVPFLSKTDRHLLFSHANLNYVTNFFQNRDKGLDYQGTVSKLLENGLMIKPVPNKEGTIESYNIGYYRLPESTYVKAGPEITNFLKANNFNQNTAASMRNLVFRTFQTGEIKVSPKFEVIVRLNQAAQKNNLKEVYTILDFIRKINNTLGDRISLRINDELKTKPEKNEGTLQAQTIIPIIQKEIAGYPADTLRDPGKNQEITSRYQSQARNGASILESIGNIFNGITDAIFGQGSGVEEEHKPEQKRKKRRRPRW